jgi:hypothetical protein
MEFDGRNGVGNSIHQQFSRNRVNRASDAVAQMAVPINAWRTFIICHMEKD